MAWAIVALIIIGLLLWADYDYEEKKKKLLLDAKAQLRSEQQKRG